MNEHRKTLSLCMIVKNKESTLAYSLNSIKSIVDEIIIVDIGSTDRTAEIAEAFQAKLYYYPWDNDFSNARNYSLKQASMDWILIMNGDEVLEARDRSELLKLIDTSEYDGYHMTVNSYLNTINHDDYTVHHALRLIKNSEFFTFKGMIHEQLIHNSDNTKPLNITMSNIVIHHYVSEKDLIIDQKNRQKNIKLIKSQLKLEPDNPLHLFSLGNEYMAIADFPKALKSYNGAIKINSDPSQDFLPYLYHRLIISLGEVKDYSNAVYKASEALALYPSCTDILYYKGLMHYNLHEYTLAIDCFNSCLELGESPKGLKFVNDCGGFRPLLSLGEIYSLFEDYDNAISVYSKALELKPIHQEILYTIGKLLKRKHKDTSFIIKDLSNYFSNLNHPPELFIFTNILIREGLYKEAAYYSNIIKSKGIISKESQYIQGQLYFYNNDYEEGDKHFISILENPDKNNYIDNLHTESIIFLVASSIIRKEKDILPLKSRIGELNNPPLEKVLLQLMEIYNKGDKEYLQDSKDSSVYLNYSISFLDKLLRVKKLKLFEEYVYILNNIESKQILLELAKLYYGHGLMDMARKTILRSLKELDTIDATGLHILTKFY